MEIVNTVPTMVIVGLRVLVGSQSVERSPAYLEVFGRATQITANRSRWVDLPFTREESLTADKKMTLFGKYGEYFVCLLNMNLPMMKEIL